MKVRVIYNKDKTVSVIHAAPGSRLVFFDDKKFFPKPYCCRIDQLSKPLSYLDAEGVPYTLEDENIWFNRVFDKATPKDAEYDNINQSELPQNREDRDAWEGEKGKGVTINQEKAQKNKKEKEYRQKIYKRKNEILEQQAIDDLKRSNDLPENYT